MNRIAILATVSLLSLASANCNRAEPLPQPPSAPAQPVSPPPVQTTTPPLERPEPIMPFRVQGLFPRPFRLQQMANPPPNTTANATADAAAP